VVVEGLRGCSPLECLARSAVERERDGTLRDLRGPRHVALALPAEQTPALLNALVTAGASVYQITPQHASLEQLFLELTDEAHNGQKANGHPLIAVATATERT